MMLMVFMYVCSFENQFHIDDFRGVNISDLRTAPFPKGRSNSEVLLYFILP